VSWVGNGADKRL